MSASDENKQIAKQWVVKAEEDFRTAEYTLTMPENCPYSTVCFHCQQCVEKYVKAILVWRSIEFPRIHDIGELIDSLPEDIALLLSEEEQELLSDYAVVVRYPMEDEPVAKDDAETALAIAKRVREAARRILPDIE
tara:strand:+ start:275 stop:682 length:408 start_codon:yes stop_codon:yes gene_type:complete